MDLKVGDIVKRKKDYGDSPKHEIKKGDIGIVLRIDINPHSYGLIIRYFKGPILFTNLDEWTHYLEKVENENG